MTFVLNPLSHYNSITEPRAQFLLYFLEHLTIDFHFHFIHSIIDVHLDSASRDKLIFPFAILRILFHFFVPLPMSDPFTSMCAIDYAIVKCSEAQFRSQQTDSALSTYSTPSRSARSASAPTSSTSDVSLGDIIAQLQCREKCKLINFQVHFRMEKIVWIFTLKTAFKIQCLAYSKLAPYLQTLQGRGIC